MRLALDVGFGFQFSYWGGGWFWHPMGHYRWYHNPPFAHRIYTEHWNPHWRGANPACVRNNVNVYSPWGRNAVVARDFGSAPRSAPGPIFTRAAMGRFINTAGTDGPPRAPRAGGAARRPTLAWNNSGNRDL
ncbi:MAG TPA: hypothetical protein VGR73_09860 [Bryobacteraceae bacterium]|nr:hypothetical protein [Bryobacteraceae bacterium]